MRKFIFLAFSLLLFLGEDVLAQSDEDAVKLTIVNLFEGMKTKNPILMRQSFHDQAIMKTVISGEDGAKLGSNTVDDFINRIATIPAETVLDERILDYQIKVDGPMATAWTPYSFYVNDSFSHCGVNSFQLIHTDNGWKITYVIDTRRKEGCF